MKTPLFVLLAFAVSPVSAEDYLGDDTASGIGLGYRASGEGLKGQRSFGPRFGAELTDPIEGAGAEGLASPRGLSAKGSGVSGVGSMPLGENVSVYGKLGVLQEEPQLNLGIPGSGTDLTYGLGLKYQFTNDLGLRFEWQRFNGGSPFDDDVLSGGLRYSF
jgi:opacity protein-like surface antigen